nr:hypothetical protein [bacterium]
MDGDPAAYALSYETGLRTLDQQMATIQDTRDRAGKLLTAATFAASLFLVALQNYRDEISNIDGLGFVGGGLAIVGFLGVVFTTLFIWEPASLRLVHDPRVIIGYYIEGTPPRSISEVHRELAIWMGDQADTNRKVLKRKLMTFSWGLAALMIEVTGMFLLLGDLFL